jgi:hypothetical protein
MAYALNVEGKVGADQDYVYKLHGKDLLKEADKLFGDFWKKHRVEGATCDFGGAAELQELVHDDDGEGDQQQQPVLGQEGGDDVDVVEGDDANANSDSGAVFGHVVGGVFGGLLVGIVVGGMAVRYVAVRQPYSAV